MSGNKRRGDVEDKEQLEFQKILENLLKEVDNKKCADCANAAPRWASAKLGVFLCIKCSGVHRSMGTHISFVRSVSLDKWKPDEIAFMQSMGNANAALIWEARLPQEYKRPSPNDSIALEKFIRDKYEHKRYFKAVDKPTQVKIEVSQGTVSPNTNATSVPMVNTSTILQPPRSSTPNLTQPPRSSTPQRTRQTESVMVDPFSSSPAQPVKQDSFFPVGQQSKQESHILFNPNVPQQPVQAQPPMAANPTSAVDMNLLKKSNIMSMFDVQTEQQKMYYTGAPQQQQQMYYASPTPQLYYTASGSFVPVMYSPQMYSAPNVVYYPQPASQ